MDKFKIESRAHELETVINGFRRHGMVFAKIEGLKNSERHFLWLLYTIAQENGQVKPSDIAKRLEVTMAAVTHQIKALEELGLIERTTSLEDRREVLISITPSGKEKITAIKQRYWQKLCSIVEYLGDEDSAKLSELVLKIAKFKTCN
jgi:DNA-binding MarR family transcriptional regulator